MPLVTVQELIDAGVHYGHVASRWNPKMEPYIHAKRHNIHIINLEETIRGLYQACHFLRKLASTGAQILFLGTKRQIRAVVESEAARCGMPAVTERWIGGTLTNYHTVRDRLGRLEELEGMEANGTLELYKKKAQATLRREMRKIRRNLEGIRELNGLPGAIVVVDPRREEITVREAARMNVPVVAILDTDCDPQKADILIPGNDDAMSSVHLLMSRLTEAIIEGRANVDEAAIATAQRTASEDIRSRQAPGRRTEQRPAGRGRPRTPQAGGRLGRRSTGRFADRAGGHADSVSIGSQPAAESADATAAAAAAAAAKGEAAGSEAPKTEPGAAGSTPAGTAAPDAAAAPVEKAPAEKQPSKPAGEAAPDAAAPADQPAADDKPSPDKPSPDQPSPDQPAE